MSLRTLWIDERDEAVRNEQLAVIQEARESYPASSSRSKVVLRPQPVLSRLDPRSWTTSWIEETDDFVQIDNRPVVRGARDSCVTDLSTNGVQLHPQPTSDPLDPLNWSAVRKNCILGIVMGLYFMFTYITTTTVPSFAEIQTLYGIDYMHVNLTVAIPSLGLAFGPLFWSSFADIYGRRVIFIVGTLIAFAGSIGTALSPTYTVYMVCRFFQGFGASPGGTVGMAIIGDLFFEYERGQKLGLWVLAINSGLLVGPIVGGFIDMAGQFWIDWVTAILFGILFCLELFFLPETLYPRHHMLKTMARMEANRGMAGSITDLDLKRTKDLPFINIRPVPGLRHPKPWDSIIRFGLTFKYPVVVLTVAVYCFSWYWWILSIVTQIPAAYSQYSPSSQGLLFLGLLWGTWFAELFCSGSLSDWLVHKLEEQNNGIRMPENRLWLAYPAAFLSAIGLILWGISIDRGYHWMVGQISLFIFMIGLQMGNTAIPSYIVDCYPLQSMSVITFYSVFLDLSALVNPFFIADWVAAHGYTNTFTIQGIITFCVSVPVIFIVHQFGPRMRASAGKPGWVNPEYDKF